MEPTDADLVVAAARGDRDAFAAIYDRYGPRIYDLCAHMLRNGDDTAEATTAVFVKAHAHLGQLQAPEKCQSWLFAIARNEVYRRTRRRARETVVDGTGVPVGTEPAVALAGLVRDAALGLDARDRLVLELTLAGDLNDRELGDALGISEQRAHQAGRRMRERLAHAARELVEQRGLDDIPAVPARFSRAAFAELPIPHLSPPQFVRRRILERTEGTATTTNGIGWKRNGFPVSPDTRKRQAVFAGIAVAIIAFFLLVVNVATGSEPGDRVAAAAPGSSAGVSVSASTVLPEQSQATTSSTSPGSGPTLTASIPGALKEGRCPGNPPVTATASDPIGVTGVSLSYRPKSVSHPASIGPIPLEKTSGNSWSLRWNAPSNGGATTRYEVSVTARDAHGNSSTVQQTVSVGACPA
jgi:RNA polymerase sigma factor (sigma-70 family)